ncbi:MAG: DUF929 family protein [Ktedonobacteraceae bacterium]|nr:DUF929 family protein [Ktedonobacteraceae bacterium]
MTKIKRRTAQTVRRSAQIASGSQQRRQIQATPAAEAGQAGKIIPPQTVTTTQHKQERLERSQQPETSRAATRAQKRNIHQRYQKRRGNPWLIAGIAVIIIGGIIGIFVYLSNQNSGNTNATGQKSTDPIVLKAINNVDPAVLEAVNTGRLKNPITATKGQIPLKKGPTGKPEVFYDGAEYCPYCAAQRWAMVVALSRFGKFTKLPETTSASADTYPNTSTVSFYGSAYSSPYIDFVPVEETTNQPDGNGGYTPLQTPTADEAKITSTYNAPPYTSQPGIPFISLGNQYLELGPAYTPANLAGLSQQDIVATFSNSSSAVAKDVLGGANYLTAAICAITNNQPASVCTTGVIPSIVQSLPKTQATEIQNAVATRSRGPKGRDPIASRP